MTSEYDLIMKISDKNVNVDEFVEMTLKDPSIRNTIVNLMLKNEKIMVYYHSYYIVSKASQLKPGVFYKYWDDFASLLNHKNSYHRDFALVLLANLSKVDNENKFVLLFDEYFSHINDVKFSTARQCIQNTAKILANKEELTGDVVDTLLDVNNRCNFPEKQKALLKSDVIELFDEYYEQISKKEDVNRFVKEELGSISPKTRKEAKYFVRKHNI